MLCAVLSLIIGFLTPEGGQILWDGARIKRGALKKNIAMVMQRPKDFFLGSTVLEELVLGHQHATPDDVRDVLFGVGLSHISLLTPPHELSGGQIKRLAVAGQLMREPRPRLFLLDEPMAGVDPAARRELAALLSDLTSDFALVIVSHEPAELLEYADRVVQLAHGQLIEVASDVINRARVRNAVILREREDARQQAIQLQSQPKSQY
jgi:energy-coupling factor transport system ATP-binding protein